MKPGTSRRAPLQAWMARRAGVGEEPLTREDVERHQLRHLQETLEWARRRSPYYRDALAGTGANRIASLSAIQRLPFTTPLDLRERGARFLCVSQGEIDRVVTLSSSGTTGLPKRLYFTADDQERSVDFFEQGLSTASVGPGDRVLILLPGGTPGSAGALIASAVERVGGAPVHHGFVTDLPDVLELMRRARPTSIVAVPVQALALARHAELARETFQLRSAFLCSDHVPGSLARALKRAWGCEVFEYYGMTEMALGGGIECEDHAGYHLQEADFHFEIVDPLTGRVLPEGSRGEIVVTTLMRRGMPLIRYRTGDLSRLIPGPCRCGTVLMRLERVTTRSTAVTVPAGRDPGVALSQLDEALFELPGVVDFAAAVTGGRDPARLAISLWSVHAPGDALIRAADEALNRIPALRAARSAGALTVRVGAQRVGPRLPRAPGKRAISELQSDREQGHIPHPAREDPAAGRSAQVHRPD